MTIEALLDIPMLEKGSRSAERLVQSPLFNTRNRYCTKGVLRSAFKLLPSDCTMRLLAVITASVPCPNLSRRAGIRLHLRIPNRGLPLPSVVGLVHSYVQSSRSRCEVARKQKGCTVMLRLLRLKQRATFRDHLKVITTSTKLAFLTRDSGSSSSSSSSTPSSVSGPFGILDSTISSTTPTVPVLSRTLQSSWP